MLSTHFALSILGFLLAASRPAHAEVDALWLEPSLKWHGEQTTPKHCWAPGTKG
jgi:hypothetical protein